MEEYYNVWYSLKNTWTDWSYIGIKDNVSRQIDKNNIPKLIFSQAKELLKFCNRVGGPYYKIRLISSVCIQDCCKIK